MTIKFDSFPLYLSTPVGLLKQFAKGNKEAERLFNKILHKSKAGGIISTRFECTCCHAENMRSAVLSTWWFGDFCSYCTDFHTWAWVTSLRFLSNTFHIVCAERLGVSSSCRGCKCTWWKCEVTATVSTSSSLVWKVRRSVNVGWPRSNPYAHRVF